MRIPITPFALLAIMASILYSSTPSQRSGYGGEDMLVQTFDSKNEFDAVEQELEEAWHFAEEAHFGTKLQCWTSCVWKKFTNLFGANAVVPEECSWGTCAGPAPTE